MKTLDGIAGVAGRFQHEVHIVGQVDGDEIVVCPELYGGFWVRRHRPGQPPYQVDETRYQRPASARRVYGSEKAKTAPKPAPVDYSSPGFTRLDRAFGDAADLYHMADYPRLLPQTEPVERWYPEADGFSPEDVSDVVKAVACTLGASLAGIAPLDERWFFCGEQTPDRGHVEIRFSDQIEATALLEDGTKLVPRSMRWLVVMAFEMDADLMRLPPSPLANVGTADATRACGSRRPAWRAFSSDWATRRSRSATTSP
jgi:hypothetical protein